MELRGEVALLIRWRDGGEIVKLLTI